MKLGTETGLILSVDNPSAKTIMLLRKLTPLSIAEIKQRALEGKPITGFPCTDEYGAEDESMLLQSIKDARKNLLELGVETRIVIDGEMMSEEHLDNRRQMLREIDEELEWEDEVRLAQEEVDQAVAELADEFEEFGWWVPDDMSFLWDELGQELPARHPLEERNLAPMARCDCNDDVLFHDGKGFLVVHLTWSKTNVLPFPLFEEVECDSIADYLRSEYLENCELE
ncbi:MAG: hypothetical protein U0N69_06360 [Senegalimassilia anaerobia]